MFDTLLNEHPVYTILPRLIAKLLGDGQTLMMSYITQTKIISSKNLYKKQLIHTKL